MVSDFKKLFLEGLEVQKEIFGDLLFCDISLTSTKNEKPDIKIIEKLGTDLGSELFEEEFQKADSLELLHSMIKECQKCSLGKTRNKF
ncbi:MAG: uracil-DNA glycosylase, partial [Ignavibacteria bacterium]|nr:uracil-DNA glycosylase [Ignavibacteria bacterium]